MFFTSNGKSPLWEQVRDELKRQILCGIIEPGSQLQSVRSLAVELSINPNTIQRAYTELERDGLTYTVSGRGCFVTENTEVLLGIKNDKLKDEFSKSVTSMKNSGIDKETLINIISEIYSKGEHK